MDVIQSNWKRYSDEQSICPSKGVEEMHDYYYRLYDFHDEVSFNRKLYLERKRMKRSQKPFLLVVMDIEKILQSNGNGRKAVKDIVSTLFLATRDIDIKGWYKYPAVIGIFYCEIDELNEDVKSTIFQKLEGALRVVVAPAQFSQIGMSFNVFQEA
jgi:hypothetical protein